MQKEIKFLINPSEITAGTRGGSLGPFALMSVARKAENYLFGTHEVEIIPDENHLLDQPTSHVFAKRIDGLVTIFQRISTAVADTLSDGKFPFVIASDHGSAGGTIAGIKKQFPNQRLGVIWIDAHGDLHSPYTTPSGNIHGMPLSTALNEDNLPCKSNDVPSETVQLWNELKSMHGIAPKIQPEDLVFVAVRDTESQEDALIERLGIKNFEVNEVNQKGTDAIAAEILDKLRDCDHIYISFDVDSMDPEVTSHGTGTPVPHGLMPQQVIDLMDKLIESRKVVCLEFVEINPCLDEKTNKMAETAYEILLPALQKIKEQTH